LPLARDGEDVVTLRLYLVARGVVRLGQDAGRNIIFPCTRLCRSGSGAVAALIIATTREPDAAQYG
jgi:hypothetical protein